MGQERTTIDYRAGHLCVRYSDTAWSEPKRYVHWWPIMRCRREDFADVIGLPAQPHRNGAGAYSVKIGQGFAGHWQTFVLRHGEKTEPIETEVTPLPPPRVRAGIETRYKDGFWQKRTKARGWENVHQPEPTAAPAAVIERYPDLQERPGDHPLFSQSARHQEQPEA